MSAKASARQAINAAAKALKEGKTGAKARLDKAIARYAKASCSVKVSKSTGKTVTAKVAKARKKKATKKRR